MRVTLIAACDRNRIIGTGNRLPWSLPEDLKRFRQITSGHPVIMGRKTYESIGRPLPNRENFVITRNGAFAAPGVHRAGSLEQALEGAREACRKAGVQEAFVIGGGEIYRQALPRADRLYLTRVETEVEGDASFPEWQDQGFRRVSEEKHPEDEKHAFAFRFEIWERSL